jgi:hypothetical protein
MERSTQLVIVESHKEWEKFMIEFEECDSIVIPVQCDEYKHPLDTGVCLLYIRLLDGNLEEYILPFQHTDTVNLKSKYIEKLNTSKDVFTYDKKKLLHFVKWKSIKDIQMKKYLDTNSSIIMDSVTTNAHDYFNRVYWGRPNLNCIIPIMKHLEMCRMIVDEMKRNVFGEVYDFYKTYNEDVLENLQKIESNGLQTTDGMVYSEYNPYTATGRPSNRFGGTNFAALNKTDGSRKKFVSRYGKDGMLVEMDYDAYHLRLIGNVVEYEFPKGSVHRHMSKLYQVSYDEAKLLSFQYLYGHIPDEVIKNNSFFEKVQVYIDMIWDKYKSNLFIESYIYNKRIYKRNLVDMNKNKLFNYLIQLMETENNMSILTKLLPKINGYKSKIILYSYDSFLFDVHKTDGMEFVRMVKAVVENKGRYPVRVSKGLNYHEMEDITEKFG